MPVLTFQISPLSLRRPDPKQSRDHRAQATAFPRYCQYLFLLFFTFHFQFIIPSASAQSGSDTEVTVTSEFSPATIRAGRDARYTVTITHSTAGNSGITFRPQVNAIAPSIPGLELSYIGQSSSTQTTFSNVSGTRRIFTIRLNFQARAENPGNYTMPSFSLTYEGRDYIVPPSDLVVLQADTTQQLDQDKILFLELLLPEGKIFVGQTVKATLQLFALDRIPNIRNNYPVKVGDAFAEGALADSQTRSRGRRGNYSYNIYSRPLTITPLKSGRQNLMYEMEVQALLPLDGDVFSADPNSQDPFSTFSNDPFFQRFNFQLNPQMQYQNILVSTDPIELDIQPLPSEGRPEEFSGAIGEFSLKAFPGTNTIKEGDPLTVRIQLAGQGNFDRIVPPDLDLGDTWKSYDPTVDFKQGDALGFTGIKTFDYTLIPLDETITFVPEISISYFDPKTESYQTLTSGQLPLTVLNNPSLDAAQNRAVTDTDSTDVEPEQREFFEINLQPGRLVSGLRPVYLEPWFLPSQTIPLLALFGFFLVRRHQIKIEKDETLRRRKEADRRLNLLLAEIGESTREGNASSFYQQAHNGIRLVLSKRFGPRAEAATADEMDQLLEECQAPPELLEGLKQLHEADEALNFAGNAPSTLDLLESRKAFESLLAAINKIV